MSDRDPFHDRHPNTFGVLFVGFVVVLVCAVVVLWRTQITVTALWPVGTTLGGGVLAYCHLRILMAVRHARAAHAGAAAQRRPVGPGGFSVWRLANGGQPDERIGDADRAAVADALSDHYAAGRLGRAEFDERHDAALSATYRRDLVALFHDLPEVSR